MAVGQPGGEKYIGDYIGNSAIGNTSYNVWMDGRANNLRSYVAYYPDYAMTTSPSFRKYCLTAIAQHLRLLYRV